jgi:hypothetical protein
MDKDALMALNLNARMQDFYKHDPAELVRTAHVDKQVTDSNTLLVMQFKSVQVFLNSAVLIGKMRTEVLAWMTKHPQSAVLVVLEGHSSISTGEIVYSGPSSSIDKHAQIDQVFTT